MKKIPLSQGKFTIVDDDDYTELSKYRWHVARFGTSRRPLFYAVRNVTIAKNKGRLELMHRRIMQAPKGTVVDHINSNSLDNRKGNMRVCSQNENMKNVRSGPNKHGYRGITKTSPGTFCAAIRVNYKAKYLGCYPTAKEAAYAYDVAALKEFGKFAKLNFPQSIPD